MTAAPKARTQALSPGGAYATQKESATAVGPPSSGRAETEGCGHEKRRGRNDSPVTGSRRTDRCGVA
ncbi:MAG: hypothetical protein LZF62_300126 [Nitrospira sp.]|nr:MAG: hypothetical protein LZF62_300126 [Nitrospira sp.]